MKGLKLIIGRFYLVEGESKMYLGKYKLEYRFHSNSSCGMTLTETKLKTIKQQRYENI